MLLVWKTSMFRTIEIQVVPVPNLLPFYPSGVHLLPFWTYATPSRTLRLLGFAHCCNISVLLTRAKFSRFASSLDSWRLKKMGLSKRCSLCVDSRNISLRYGFGTLRRNVLVLLVSFFLSRVTSPIAAWTLMCSKNFWTSLELCSCRQRASSFFDSGLWLNLLLTYQIVFPSIYFKWSVFKKF